MQGSEGEGCGDGEGAGDGGVGEFGGVDLDTEEVVGASAEGFVSGPVGGLAGGGAVGCGFAAGAGGEGEGG